MKKDVCYMKKKIDEILIQVITTNSRVTTLEKWRDRMVWTGGGMFLILSVILSALMVIPKIVEKVSSFF